MPISNVTQWSATAASNVDIGGITLDGAVMTPSQVDNAIRELMAQVAGGISASYFIPSGATFASPVLTTPQINDTSADHQYVFAVSELAADRTITLPLLTGNDTFVFAAFTQTLTNKTLTNPTIAAITGPTAVTGAASATTTITAGTDLITTSGVLTRATSGTISIRPGGASDTTNNMDLDSSGNLTIKGTLTVTG